ncbi:uncharacterized protein [Ovis canadensis]|uniref:uncharacterized protein n=1 Tax=Ovis canadensis TaxID=37174 RepID=UPI0038B50602
MPGESVSPSRGSGEAEGEREGEREPRRRRRGRRRLLPFPPCRPLCPLPLGARGALRARARVGPARAGARSAALRRGRRARGSGRGRRRAGAGPGLPQPCASGCRGDSAAQRGGNPVLHVENLAAAQPRGQGSEPCSRDSGARAVGTAHASKSRCPDPRPPGPVLSDLGCSHHPAPRTSFGTLRLESRCASLLEKEKRTPSSALRKIVPQFMPPGGPRKTRIKLGISS